MTKQVVVDEPLPSVENGNDNTDENQSIWASILRDVKSSTKKAPATKSLVVLGDNESGRTTLVAKLQGTDDPKRGAGLEYHYIDVKDDDRDDTPKLGVWILDGDVACSAPLLKFAIKSENLENTILILVASMTQPWSLLSTLKKWITLVEEHIDRLKIDPIRLREMRDHLQYDFQHYIEPNDSSIMLTSSASSTTIKSGVGGRVPSSVSSASLASTTPLSPTNGDEQVVLPLPDGVLTKSLGIPIIVVITKCDIMPTLEKENDYKDEYFDFMQHHLRKFCLEYGAALFYTSVKEKKNIDKLYKYIVYKCYGYPFTSTAAIVERDAIFIPTGWDNPKKADILLENLHRLKSTDIYSDVFIKPVVRRPLQRDNEIITAEDDQEFLSRLQLTLNRAASPGRAEENATPVLTRTSGVSGGVGSQTPSVAGRPRAQQNPTPGGTTTAANEGALANFFNSLLTRKSGGAVTPTAATTPVTQRQTSQSPTTPSSKRLQQHPLTFAVTPPPGRTRTPTSHKAFPSSLNVESPPKLLSPVAEQQSKVEATSPISSTVARTPVEDNELGKISDTTENKQSEPTNDDLQLKQELITNEDQQNTNTLTSQDDTVPNPINNSDTDILNSSSQSLSHKENESTNDNHRRLSNDFSLSQNITQKEESDILQYPSVQPSTTEDSRNDEHLIDNSSSITQPRSISPSQPNELSNIENFNDVSSTDQLRSSSPTMNDNNKLHDRSPSLDHMSSRLLSDVKLENTQQLNDEEDNAQLKSQFVSQEETLNSTIENISSNINNEEQQDDSSRRNSVIDSFISSEPLNSIPNVSQEQEDKTLTPVDVSQTQSHDDVTDVHSENELSNEVLASEHLDRRFSSSDVRETESPIRSRPISPAIIRAHEEHDDNSSIPAKTPNKDSINIQPRKLSSMSNMDIPEEEQQEKIATVLSNTNNNENRSHSPVEPSEETHIVHSTEDITSSPIIEKQKSFESSLAKHSPSSPTSAQQEISSTTEENLQKSPTHETLLSSFSIPQNLESTNLVESPTLESGDIKPDFDENTTSLHMIRDNYERSRSPSPITKQEERERDQSPSSTIQEKQQRSRSPSPVAKEEQQRSRSPSPLADHEQERSRSPSLVIQQGQERSRSPSPIKQEEQERSRSPSPVTKEEQQKSRSPSPLANQEQERSRSPSLTKQEEPQRSRSSSLTKQEEPQRSRSPSPVPKQEQERSRSPSPTTQEEQQRSRSPSLVAQQEPERSRSPSPIVKQEQEKSRSPSLTTQEEQQRSRSPSLTTQEEQQRNRSPSLAAKQEEQERSRSPSLTTQEEQQRNRSPSLTTQEEQQRSRSPSLATKQERSRSPSLNTQEEQQRSRSPSPIKQERSRSPSPIVQQEQQRSRSPSPVPKQEQERSRSPSLTTQEEQQRSRSPSPIVQQEQERSRSPSPITKQEEQKRSRFPSLTTQEEQQRSRSPSLVAQQEPERSRSPSPIAKQEQQRSRSPSPVPKQEQERSRSPSLTTQEEQQRSRSPSPVKQEEQQKSPSPSPIVQQEQQRSRSPSPVPKQEPERSRSPSPITKQEEQERSRSPSLTKQEEPQRSRSQSPVVQQGQERSRSPSPIVKHEQERSRSPSHIVKQEPERSRSPSPIVKQESERSRSPSPIAKQDQERSRSPSPIVKQEQQRSESLSFNNEQERDRPISPVTQQNLERSGSPYPSIGQNQQRSDSLPSTHNGQRKTSFSIEPLENKLDSIEDERSLPRTHENHEIKTQPIGKIASSPTIDNQEDKELDTLASPIHENDRRDSSSEMDQSTLNLTSHKAPLSPVTLSPKMEDNNSSQSLTHFNYENQHNLRENSAAASPIAESKQQGQPRSPSPTERQETSFVKTKRESQVSSVASPLSTSVTENESPQVIKSPINESNPSTIPEKHDTITPNPPIDQEQQNLSHSSPLIESKSSGINQHIPPTQNSSWDLHHESNSSSFPITGDDHQSSISRSHSQSMLARPNTLPFSPNNHDMDGLYVSNDYDDEDEVSEHNEYHPNSAPSTVNVEHRRSSLLQDNIMEQNHSPIDPNDISKRLSVVGKSRTEDSDNNAVDLTNSKDS